MPTKPNLVIFCGAGASVCAGIPVMSGFTDKLRDSGHLEPDEQREFDNIVRTCNEMSGSIGASARNLEQLASFLAILQFSQPDFTFPDCKRFSSPEMALGLLVRCIRFIALPNLDSNHAGHATRLVELESRTRLTFITTNYDLHLELGAILGNRRLRPTPSILALSGNSPNRANLYDVDQNHDIQIFKLHGSVNWYHDGSGGVAVEHELSPAEPGQSLTYSRGLDDSLTLIVPPTIIKPTLKDVLQEQWRGASRAIAQADQLWFLGYSFPESDSFMQYFFAASLIQNMHLRQIAVVDPDRAVLEDRAARMFSAPHLREVFKPFPCPWENYIQLGQLLTSDYQAVIPDGMVEMLRRKMEHEQILQGELPATKVVKPTGGRPGRFRRL